MKAYMAKQSPNVKTAHIKTFHGLVLAAIEATIIDDATVNTANSTYAFASL